jgi:TatA/E family protein of Tat protein translocase
MIDCLQIGFLPTTGFPEWLLIFGAILLLFGAKRMPEIARTIGRIMHDIRRASDDFRSQIMTADMDDHKPHPAVHETVPHDHEWDEHELYEHEHDFDDDHDEYHEHNQHYHADDADTTSGNSAVIETGLDVVEGVSDKQIDDAPAETAEGADDPGDDRAADKGELPTGNDEAGVKKDG